MIVSAKRLSEGLVGITYDHDRTVDKAIWSAVVTRKDWKCRECGKQRPKGVRAFAPIGNQMYRMHRLCRECVEAAQ